MSSIRRCVFCGNAITTKHMRFCSGRHEAYYLYRYVVGKVKLNIGMSDWFDFRSAFPGFVALQEDSKLIEPPDTHGTKGKILLQVIRLEELVRVVWRPGCSIRSKTDGSMVYWPARLQIVGPEGECQLATGRRFSNLLIQDCLPDIRRILRLPTLEGYHLTQPTTITLEIIK